MWQRKCVYGSGGTNVKGKKSDLILKSSWENWELFRYF